MENFDPHTHIDADLHVQVGRRSMLASTFGLAADLPSHATTGCDLRVPYATTSTDPAKVTCLPCREFARRRYRELAEQVVRMTAVSGLGTELHTQAGRAAAEYRALAERFG
ncbi:hypothetical protein [Paractinoplanes lichenicola]|uniref:Uncharacterized protein n=1 Tax=Paractinoplanes lichenicola TaxID=2802976 RepID=A0ABS1VY96_9ACTN|nr:hypothetical protein [Actinoplanes lichenicola]MBL7259419.1 hypothetical protein [Actinoplanes lichenicola]